MRRYLATVLAGCLGVCVMSASYGLDGMVRNGSFEVDSDGDGMADDWQFAGDEGVTATWACCISSKASSQLLSTPSLRHMSEQSAQA